MHTLLPWSLFNHFATRNKYKDAKAFLQPSLSVQNTSTTLGRLRKIRLAVFRVRVILVVRVSRPDVGLQVTRGVGAVSAEGAGVGLLPGVDPEVLLQVVAPPRPVVAVRAREQGVLGVLLHVATQVRLARGGVAAEDAAVGGEHEVGGGGARGRRLLLLVAGQRGRREAVHPPTLRHLQRHAYVTWGVPCKAPAPGICGGWGTVSCSHWCLVTQERSRALQFLLISWHHQVTVSKELLSPGTR